MAQPHDSGNETVLRKYPNRRIYDPTRNCHVTLNDLADRVKQGERIRIVDHQTGEDITHVIMGQVLYETLKTRPDYLPLDLVLLMIRAQDNVVRDFLWHWLPQSFHAYLENQRRMMAGLGWMNPGFAMPLPSFGNPFAGLFQMGGPGYGPASTGPATPPPAPGPAAPPPPFPGSAPMGGGPAPSSPAGTPAAGDTEALKRELERLKTELEALKQAGSPAAGAPTAPAGGARRKGRRAA
ncbi:MAG: hypothetical protein OZSIB_1752 [Candidatus Ozemobacter sibiricus]|jgi:polyhydroxyalkanoate synthesis repressor PhaR|uniref:PHA accumulation regulator DNA-binding N-terminal domain-containing protein n=1 Tax=Candidatus Ozemobacter sibiricus TaxID=2268124 RepID=A0A367ZIZ1_9BACT|nr:MAG: hypothetical protein OZSIB_1752 [Candidatus Ozemobacter sibiricus]